MQKKYYILFIYRLEVLFLICWQYSVLFDKIVFNTVALWQSLQIKIVQIKCIIMKLLYITYYWQIMQLINK